MHIPQTAVILRHDGTELARVTLPPGEYVIGRDADVEIFADTPLLSRRHAQLTINYDHLLIEDLGSSNGTFVNEQPITEATRLFPNQAVRLGDVTVELRRERARSDSGASLAPAQAAIRRFLPEEILSENRYAIGGELARGGMGAILDARQNATQRTVAMKVMLGSGDEADVLRFIEEAQVTAQLDHPNIVPIYELGVDEQDQLFYTMKMVRGITLKKVIELLVTGVEATVKKYPLPALLTIFQKVCDAVAFAHAKGVIHRDLKPENIMLGDFGSVLVMDWGLAKVLAKKEAHRADLTRSLVMSARASAPEFGSTMAGQIMGTPQYMAPEQARGEVETLDARADVYALGAILFEILHLRAAVTGNDPMEVVGKVERGEIEWSAAGRAFRLPDSLLAVCRQALAFDREQRYSRVEDLQADILAYQNGFATSAEKAGAWKQFTLFVKRHKVVSMASVILFLLLAAFVTNVILSERRMAIALAALRRTAPVFYAQAKIVFDDGKLDEAIEKIGYAIQLDAANADYHLFRANLRESSQDLAGAAEGYRRVLALRPADAAAKTNLALCEQLLQETGGAPLGQTQLHKLLTVLHAQRRLVEAAPLAALVNPNILIAKAAIIARLREARKQPGWVDRNVSVLPDGSFRVELRNFAPIDFAVLKDQPVTELCLLDSGIADLSSLAGLPLKDLDLRGSKATDLSPLRGMRLEKFNLASGKATDLSPLHGMPVKDLDLTYVPVKDLSPLLGMKLSKLMLGRTQVSNLSPLAGMPLTILDLSNCPKVSDISPLHGAPLVVLSLGNTGVTSLAPLTGAPLKHLDLHNNVKNATLSDISPLAKCVSLEELILDGLLVTDLTPLAKLPLTFLDCSETKITSVAPLRGLPLRFLSLWKTGVTDLSPLAASATLEEIILPDSAGDLSMLRKLLHLRLISVRRAGNGLERHPAQTADEFWKEYDADRAAGKK